MLFLRENCQRLAGFKFIECQWSMIRLIFIYFIKKGIISAPSLALATIGRGGQLSLLLPSSGVPVSRGRSGCLQAYAILCGGSDFIINNT